jgi:undecaprenyl-diphosphatase
MLHGIQAVDQRLLLFSYQSRSWLAQNSRRVSRTADGHGYIIIPLLLGLLTESGDALVFQVAVAFALERPVYWVLKNSLRRKRPAQAMPGFQSSIIASDEFSFPSGHTCAAFLFVTLLVLHYGVWLAPLYLWAVAVAMSRVFLGVHFPTDTVVGAVLGAGLALGTVALMA